VKEINQALLEAIDKMHNYLKDKNGVDADEIKLDVAIANTTKELAKTFFSGQLLMYRVNNAEINNKIVLKENN